MCDPGLVAICRLGAAPSWLRRAWFSREAGLRSWFGSASGKVIGFATDCGRIEVPRLGRCERAVVSPVDAASDPGCDSA